MFLHFSIRLNSNNYNIISFIINIYHLFKRERMFIQYVLFQGQNKFMVLSSQEFVYIYFDLIHFLKASNKH